MGRKGGGLELIHEVGGRTKQTSRSRNKSFGHSMNLQGEERAESSVGKKEKKTNSERDKR